ncbi:cation diffusion facilitator family transporter [Propionibacterium australiense]|uniref:Cation diffusion facilitator family transporter n=1 Tax=Propionibacterium australiense TaxID=119981 RepID=A0A383S7G9_9ACTN|nr:cation diffusion facilitator family transporter [Propionibacterium australiense]RLP08771.1 cation diffusion facilitator family transporter [Propionibacterium australiense]SYZ33354.1 CDF: cation diffusion facilitator family transporter [Propionibacterium australiense]VEH89743.1 Cadmium, cobalt and zinc/H(+)-K(+) antiporter [Propionibacterium australiense]
MQHDHAHGADGTRRRPGGPDEVHEHHDHDHGVTVTATTRRGPLWGALLLLLAFMLVEVVVAVLTGSLALLSDAGHMLTDAASIAIALWAARLAARPPRGAMTFGWRRAEIISAMVNGVSLLVVAVIVLVEAIERLVDPPEVDAVPVMVVALVGMVVNVVDVRLVAAANRTSLNVEGAYQHILTDLFGFIGTFAAAAVIHVTGWMRADAIASLVVVLLMVRAGVPVTAKAVRVLMEAAPSDLDLEEVRRHLLEVDHVLAAHDLHAWTVTSGVTSVSAHVIIADECFTDAHANQILDELDECLATHFDIVHSTIQLEPASHQEHEHNTTSV